MSDIHSKSSGSLRIDPNQQIVKSTEIDQQWAGWLAPTRRSFLSEQG